MRIAILEDDEKQADFIRLWLEAAGHNCVCFSTGQGFIDNYQDDCFDLLVFDWMLPDINGNHVLKWVRQNAKQYIPAIFVTTRDSAEDIVQTLESGADDYLVKPVQPLELLARLTALSKRVESYQQDEAILKFPPYRIDKTVHEITLHGESIKLTHKEFELALYLFLNEGRLLSRQQLLKKVWGSNSELNTRTVDTHASRIRKKLSLNSENGWQLKAVYHYGYRLELEQTAEQKAPTDT